MKVDQPRLGQRGFSVPWALLAALLALAFSGGPAAAQVPRSSSPAAASLGAPATIDLDSYYSSPLAVGVAYSNLTAFSSFASGFQHRDLSTELRVPIPSSPSLQPFARFGLLSVTEAGQAASGQWDHGLYYAALGMGYGRRFAKNFEIGADLAAGAGQSAFPDLVAGGPVGSIDLLAGAGARIALIPSFNFSVEIRPEARYRRSFGPLDEFDGFSYGVGFSALYRLGEDPDAPVRAVRSLRLGQTKLPAAYAAMQGYYSRNPLGTVRVTNGESIPLTELELSFFQPGYMDSPTPVLSLPSLAAGATLDAGILAAFNQEVFKTEGMTPLAGQLIARYRVRGKPVEQVMSLSYDLYDRSSVTWDDDRKVGAFVTPADSALRNYVSHLRQVLKQEDLPLFNAPVQAAAQAYAGLASLGLIYQADPSSPFTRAQGDHLLVDSISVGRDTLARGAGDCDDLTVLFASLLETTGVETGWVTVPGHIFPALNTGLPATSWRELNPDRGMGFVVDGKIWIPVEITLVGRQGFLEAWRRGAELMRLSDGDAAGRVFTRTAAAQTLFGPVALRESDLGLQYGAREALVQAYRQELARIGDASLAEYAAAAKASGDKRDYSALGLAQVRFGRLKDAEAAFTRAIKLDPSLASAQVNLGNLAFLQKDYKKALGLYQAAASSLQTQGRGSSPTAQTVLVNISKAWGALGNFPEAKSAFAKAESIDPAAVREFAYLAQGGGSAGSEGKAAGQSDAPLFLAGD